MFSTTTRLLGADIIQVHTRLAGWVLGYLGDEITWGTSVAVKSDPQDTEKGSNIDFLLSQTSF